MTAVPERKRARKDYKCDLCACPIKKGEVYIRVSYILDNMWSTSVQHTGCYKVFNDIDDPYWTEEACLTETFVLRLWARDEDRTADELIDLGMREDIALELGK